MAQIDDLRSMVATMLMLPEAEIRPETSLAQLNTSLGSARLRLGLKRLGLNPPATPAATFGGLVSALTTESASAPIAPSGVPVKISAVSTPPRANIGELQVGLDVEEIRSLPAAADFWEHEFYQGTFSRPEIAYAVLQEEPRTHFAGFWCAKEALRKCDSAFAATSLNALAVSHDPDGRPYLTLLAGDGPLRLQHALSISHTSEVATAVVVTRTEPQTIPAEKPGVPDFEPVPGLPASLAPEIKKRSGLARFLGV